MEQDYSREAHVLRHSGVVQVIEAGAPLERIGDVAGHEWLHTTLAIYGRLRADDLTKYLEQ
jgi:site-specific recombinase XerD